MSETPTTDRAPLSVVGTERSAESKTGEAEPMTVPRPMDPFTSIRHMPEPATAADACVVVLRRLQRVLIALESGSAGIDKARAFDLDSREVQELLDMVAHEAEEALAVARRFAPLG